MAGSIALRLRGAFAAALAGVAAHVAAFDPAPPESRRDATVETYFGKRVDDPYRWLEDTAASATLAWFEAQNAYARRLLDALPGRASLQARLAALNTADVRIHGLQWAGDRLFYLKRNPGEQTYKLYARDDLGAPERLLVDPDDYKTGNQPAAIDYFRASPNGKRLAYGVSAGGSEEASLHVLEVATRARVGTPIPRARWASPAWRFDGSVLFFTQQRELPPGSPAADVLRGSRAWMRSYGSGGAPIDVPVFGPGLDPAVTIDPDHTPSIEASPVSPFAIGIVQHGVQRELSLYVVRLTELRGAATKWRKLAGPEHGVVGFDLRGEWIYLVTNERAPRYRVVRWSLTDPRAYSLADADPLVPESDRVVRSVSVAKDALFVQQQDAGYGKLLRLDYRVEARPAVSRTGSANPARRLQAAMPKGARVVRESEVRLPYAGAVQELVTNPLHAGAVLRLSGWTQAPGYFTVDGKALITRTALLPPARADFSGIAATQVRIRSHDGVEVPVSIVHPKDTVRDGSARVMLDVYGAYGISQEPFFSPSLLAWLERGGVFVVAHVRGGGELGKDWHHAGFKATKANTWRDTIAVAQWLVAERWTAPGRLALSGGSAGGIAVGNAMLERPDLFAAIVSQAGFHDTLRGEVGMVGPANVPEFGSVTTEDGFRDLLAMSSYARVRDGTAYPAALFTTGFNDPRVDAWDPAKMAARLQAVNAAPGGSGRPVLLRVDFAGGHGGGTAAQVVDEYTDVFAFLLWQTGAPDFAPP